MLIVAIAILVSIIACVIRSVYTYHIDLGRSKNQYECYRTVRELLKAEPTNLIKAKSLAERIKDDDWRSLANSYRAVYAS